MNDAIFFSEIRQSIYRGRMSQSQVDGINAILAGWKRYGDGDIRKLANVLATSYHETAHTMQAIHERGRRSYFNKYEPGTRIGRNLGNTKTGDGFRFRGRGHVQLTGRANYAKMSKEISIDLVSDPDKALDTEISVRIMIVGMMRGMFTGKGLPDYINDRESDFRNARRVVNGLDKASLIAGYSDGFLDAIQAAKRGDASSVTSEPIVSGKPSHQSTTTWAAGAAGVAAVSGAAKQVAQDITDIGAISPWIAVAIIGAGAAIWIIRERRRHARENGV